MGTSTFRATATTGHLTTSGSEGGAPPPNATVVASNEDRKRRHPLDLTPPSAPEAGAAESIVGCLFADKAETSLSVNDRSFVYTQASLASKTGRSWKEARSPDRAVNPRLGITWAGVEGCLHTRGAPVYADSAGHPA
jgi:hypothetical protein